MQRVLYYVIYILVEYLDIKYSFSFVIFLNICYIIFLLFLLFLGYFFAQFMCVLRWPPC